MSPSKNDLLIYQKLFIDSVNRGIADAEAGKAYTTEELKKELERRRSIRLFNLRKNEVNK